MQQILHIHISQKLLSAHVTIFDLHLVALVLNLSIL